MKQPEQIILGIDPGSLMMGYAIVGINQTKPFLLLMDVLKLGANKNINV